MVPRISQWIGRFRGSFYAILSEHQKGIYNLLSTSAEAQPIWPTELVSGIMGDHKDGDKKVVTPFKEAEEKYIKRVEECRLKKLPDTIDNSSEMHAAIVIRELFKSVLDQDKNNRDVKIVSGRLVEGVFNKSIAETSAALDAVTCPL
jgi:hypothetical protein